jgi:Uma2 family endonuclease
MVPNPTLRPQPLVIYPESDGKPMADNTRQLQWIMMLYGNLCALFHEAANVFVGSNQFWYPVEGEPDLRRAPDVYVVFGRPKGHRPSYKQWEEDGIPMTVVFEILSPGNDMMEMIDTRDFYDQYGVEEYYLYDPDRNRLIVYVRRQETLVRCWQADGYVSPRLGIRFDLSGPEMVVYYPSGRRFLTFEELNVAREQAEQRAARLAELSRKARRGQATPEELQELDRLEEESSPSSP